MTQPPAEIQSPCVRNCCLDNQDICLGCHRTLDEILNWSSASSQQQLEILRNCKNRKLNNHQSELP